MPRPSDSPTGLAIARHADALDAASVSHAQDLVSEAGMAFPAAYDTLVSEFIRRVRQRTTAEVSDADGRSALWQVRVRLYNLARGDEPEADSDPDLAADKMGVTIIRSLPGVAEHVAALASAFHGAACLGLDNATLRHRLKGLRPTISRRGGDAVWRIPYKIAAGEWLARVDLQRVSETGDKA